MLSDSQDRGLAVGDGGSQQMAAMGPLNRLPVTFSEIFPVGLLITLISAGLLQNSRLMPARRPATA